MSWSGPQLTRVVMFATLLLAVLLMRRPCADAVGRFFSSFDETQTARDGGVRAVPKPEAIVDDTAAPASGTDPYKTEYVEIKPGMTDAEIQAAIQKAREKAVPVGVDAGVAPTPQPSSPSPSPPSGAP